MRILVIPDVHGTDNWKKAYNLIAQVDKVVFLGDYVDNYEEQYNGQTSIDNFKEIVEFKKEYNEKVDLLIGNHDISYFTFTGYADSRVSGHQNDFAKKFNEMFKKSYQLMKVAVKYDDIVFSHAGFTKAWFEDVKSYYNDLLPNDPVEASNILLKNKDIRFFNFSSRCYDGSGDSIYSGPCWVRPYSLLTNSYYDKQIVGHTEYALFDYEALQLADTKIILCDSRNHDIRDIIETDKLPAARDYISFAKWLKTLEYSIYNLKSRETDYSKENIYPKIVEEFGADRAGYIFDTYFKNGD